MDSIFKALRYLGFLKYFQSDWAKLVALAGILIAVFVISSSADWLTLLISMLFAIIVLFIKLWFDLQKHIISCESDVEKYRIAYKSEEEKHKNPEFPF